MIAEIARKRLFAGERLQIDRFEARAVSDACGEVDRQSLNVVVLPFCGLFARHDTPSHHVIGTPSHAVFFASDVSYRLAFPGAIGDRALTLRFDRDLAPDLTERRRTDGGPAPAGLLPARAILLRDLLRKRLESDCDDAFEAEALGLELLNLALSTVRPNGARVRSATLARRRRAVERVKEAVALAPSEKWTVARLAGSPMCRRSTSAACFARRRGHRFTAI
jgi:hypothetical protein